MAEFTDAEMSNLSEAERDALGDESTSTPPVAEGSGTARVVEADGTVTEIIGANDKDDDTDPATETTVGAASATQDDAITTADDEGEEAFQPQYVAPMVEGMEAKLADLATTEAALEAKFDEGEITFAQFRIEQKKIEQERMDLRAQQIKGEIAAEQAAQSSEQKWSWECQRFFKQTARTEGIDYRAEANKPLMDSINLYVVGLANMPENKDKDGEWFLAKAHEMVKVQHNLKTLRADTTSDPKKDKVKEAIEARKPQTKGISDTTVAHLPNAGDTRADSDTGGDEFSDVDKLSGIELEQKLASMPKDVANRYLSAR